MKEVCPGTSRYKPSNMDDLPQEVLSEVASHLDFKDILSFQQTSKSLRSAAESHVVWLALAKKYSAQHFHLYRPETLSFADLKTEEVRTWIRKRLMVDQIWPAHRVQPHFRIIPGNERTATLKLVPGSRWLLAGYPDGSVYYCDLDLENLKRVLLLPPTKGLRENIDDLKVHVDGGSSRLEFKLVVNKRSESGSIMTKDGDFHVWQIKVADDGNTLAAEPLNSIPYRDAAYISSLAFGRHLLACATPFRPASIEVIWWEQCTGVRDLRTRFSTGHGHIDEIHLVGEDKLLCMHRGGVVGLYTLPEIHHTDGYVSPGSHVSPSREPIWLHRFSGGMYLFSSPVGYNGTAYRLAFNIGDQIWGLVIPSTKDSDPSVVKLSEIPQPMDTCAVGLFRAYTFHKEEGISIRIGYSWGGGDDIPTIRHYKGRRRDVLSYSRYPVFDEELGRFFYVNDRGIVVVEYFR